MGEWWIQSHVVKIGKTVTRTEPKCMEVYGTFSLRTLVFRASLHVGDEVGGEVSQAQPVSDGHVGRHSE